MGVRSQILIKVTAINEIRISTGRNMVLPDIIRICLFLSIMTIIITI